MDVDMFSRSLIAYPTSNHDATTVAKVIINMLIERAYLLTATNSVHGSLSVYQVNKKVAENLEITLQHATKKHSEIIECLNEHKPLYKRH